MRSLLDGGADVTDLHAVYADGWLPEGGVRANFVSSVDGAITAGGKSAGLQTPGDNRVFATIRDLADVVLVGAGTAQTEGYRPVSFTTERTARRRALGLPAGLVVAVISGGLHLDPVAALYADPSTIVFTTARADPAVRTAVKAEVIDCGATELDLGQALAALRSRGLTRILCEGGPSLLASLAGAGHLDELCLTVSPVLSGPGSGRLTAGAEWAAALDLKLFSLLEEDGALFSRYRVDATQ